MTTYTEPHSPVPHNRLFYDSVDKYRYPIVKKLREELGFESNEQAKHIQTAPTKLPLLKACYSHKHFKASTAGENSNLMKRTAVQEFIATKRDILLHKIRLAEKQTLIQDLKEDFNYKENYLNKKVKSLNDDVGLLKQNFDELKQRLENLLSEVGYLRDEKDERDRLWQETRNKIINTEADIRKIDKKIFLFKNYRGFISSLFGHFNQTFDDEVFLKNPQSLRFEPRKSLLSTLKRQESSSRLNKKSSNEEKNFFITATLKNRRGFVLQTSVYSQIQEEFTRLMALLESQQYQMMSELQNDEADIIDIDADGNR
jgi:hypothetical protein